ncbi:hypothetical protein M942_04085 [Enterobacter ludwigii]|jgi:hypothetical protein|uniref:hypothetical protein n=1 Tax=Enterobacter ludwigii TaxID=299767 RepID=UPI0003D87775|nr:hypothetical protein [Enterobacter ludwigii]AHE72480.1 hypothetical protein M942_04085 [Enterobacter ludwigii]KLP39981.1 hypothetical protein ABR36_10270 [Enterobacter ludwigii]
MNENTPFRNGRSLWTITDLTYLEEHYKTMSLSELVQVLGRTPVAIRLMASKLACQRNIPRWTDEEEDILRKHYVNGAGIAHIRMLLKGKTRASIFTRAAILGLTSGRYWREEELRVLRKHYPDMGNSVAELLPGRSRNSVGVTARRLGLRKSLDCAKGYRPWSDDEWALLDKNMHLSAAEQREMLFPHRTKKAVEKARWTLRRKLLGNRE